MSLIDFCYFYFLFMAEWVGGREKHAMSTSGEICFHSIRNFSPCHVYEWVLLFFQSFLLISHRWWWNYHSCLKLLPRVVLVFTKVSVLTYCSYLWLQLLALPIETYAFWLGTDIGGRCTPGASLPLVSHAEVDRSWPLLGSGWEALRVPPERTHHYLVLLSCSASTMAMR
jgi:hypothetical protein